MTTYVCTAGASVAAGCPGLAPLQRQASRWDADTQALREQVDQRLAVLDLASAAGRARASAELNALHRAGLHGDDEVILLTTDTAEGRCCAEAVRGVLLAHFGLAPPRVVVERIAGLQVHDAEALRRQGLANLSRRVLAYLNDPQRRYGGGCVLCPNGGFKGVVPFVTLLGMLFRAPVVYVFELADCLIRLPPLPLGLATDLFDRALPAIRWARAQGIFDVNDFLRHVTRYEAEESELFNGFLELADGEGASTLASLSPLAEVLTQNDADADVRLMLSPRAAADLEALDGRARNRVEPYLARLASSLWRSLQVERKIHSDLDFFVRGHQTWRFAGFTSDGVFHLCWFAQHNDYETWIAAPERQRAAFPLEAFRPYDWPASAAEGKDVGDDPDRNLSWLDMQRQRDEANARARLLRDELHEANRTSSQQRQQLKDDLGVWRAECERLQAQVQKLKRSQRKTETVDQPSATETVAEGPKALAGWRGRVLLARLVEERERSLIFSIVDAEAGCPDVVVPRSLLSGLVPEDVVRLEVVGHDDVHLQGAPAHSEVEDDISGSAE